LTRVRTFAVYEQNISALVQEFPLLAATTLSSDLFEQTQFVMNIQLQPEGIVADIFPLEGNEGAIGHDLLHDPARQAVAFATIKKGAPVVAGPLTLIQNNKTALIVRYAVFVPFDRRPHPWTPPFDTFPPRTRSHAGDFTDPDGERAWWGFTAALIDWELFLKATISSPDFFVRIVAEESSDELHRSWDGGPASLDEPKVARVHSNYVNWQLQVSPKDGWKYQWGTLLITVVVLTSTTLTFILLYLLVTRMEAKLWTIELLSTTRKLKQQTKALDSARHQVHMFLGYICHEVRNPLGAMSSAIEILDQDTMLNEQSAGVVQMMRQSLTSATKILNDSLSLNKMDEGMLVLDPALVDLPKLCQDTATYYKQECKSKGNRLVVQNEALVDKFVLVDVVRIEQVLRNLISNAVKFTPPGGTITVLTKPGPMPELMTVEVTDTGIGISEEDAQDIFSAYVQIAPGKHQKGGGAGLGLAIAKNIVNLHNGELSLESTPGVVRAPTRRHDATQGSTFRMVLPVVNSDRFRRVTQQGVPEKPTLDINETAGGTLLESRQVDTPSSFCHSGPGLWEFAPRPSVVSSRSSGVELQLPDVELLSEARPQQLNVVVEPPRPTPPAPSGVRPLEGFYLILIDDNAVLRKMTAMLLTKWGANVVTGVSGIEFLQLTGCDPECNATATCGCTGCAHPETLQRKRFDFALVDSEMPSMSGCEAVTRFRTQCNKAKLAHVPVIFLTGDTRPERKGQFLEAGGDAVLLKPFRREDFSRCLYECGIQPRCQF